MIYVFNDGRDHYKPELLTEKEKEGGFLLEKLPEPEKIEGKQAVMKVDVEKQQVTYEYVDIVT